AAPHIPQHGRESQRGDLCRQHTARCAWHLRTHCPGGAVHGTGSVPRRPAAVRDRVRPAGGVRHQPLPRAAAGSLLHD
ncbi:unnamed protein product, partial [Closterium sp. NIES-53]